jgi:hypothetical protein
MYNVQKASNFLVDLIGLSRWEYTRLLRDVNSKTRTKGNDEV